MSDISQYKTSISEFKSEASNQLVATSKKLVIINAIKAATNFFTSDTWVEIKSKLTRSDSHALANEFLSSIPNIPKYAIYDNGVALYDKFDIMAKIPHQVKTLIEKVDLNQGTDLYTLDGYILQAIGSTVIYSNTAETYVSIIGPTISGDTYTYNIQVEYYYYKIDSFGYGSIKTMTQNPITLTFDISAKTLTVSTFQFKVKSSYAYTMMLDEYYINPPGVYTATVLIPLNGTVETSVGSISFVPNSDGSTSTMNINIPNIITIKADQTKIYNYAGNITL